jgi:hypothetical protein
MKIIEKLLNFIKNLNCKSKCRGNAVKYNVAHSKSIKENKETLKRANSI